MSKFKIDRQTLDELNLLGKFRAGSVYHLFNQVRTRGGEQLLDEMFNNPLSSTVLINERSETFRCFQEHDFRFDYDVQVISVFREYLDTKTYNHKIRVYFSLLSRSVLARLTRDERYKKSIQGFQAIIQVLKKTAALMPLLSWAPEPFRSRVQEIQALLERPEIDQLLQMDIYSEIALGRLVFYEHLLKGRLLADMGNVLSFIYELDVYQAVGMVARAKGLRYATALEPEKNIFRCQNLRHPCIEKAIGNDLLLEEDSNVLFLTGANMAGKSTWMKSLGIGIYLAHMGFPVAADSFEFSLREGLYSSINVADNINLGYSHFYAEVIRVKQAAEAAASGARLMLMFDELFKGTNVKDAFDGTLAVTEGFAEYTNCLFVVSTHIIEVGEELRSFPNIQFRYMPTILEGGVPRYTYRLKEGITEDRQGMMIIQGEKILELLDR
ncbi:DNA mismatch repair protein [Pedobacter sp. HMWF019]|uniref:MutS-related protein n=1 Tax=Pedobacter sp. HMWF019 TaxID=2056856 RepID=UPI000D37C856|nr:DNA mismatch repair protein [Pedobacter sp. HMWF019]PTS97081.1 DNA mismatch repair protein [Pedobacter sp. HMWF019]